MRPLALLILALAASSPALGDAPTPTHADMNSGGMNHSDMIAPKTPQIMLGYGSGGLSRALRSALH